MNISLTPKLEEYVRMKVASGLYNNASELMREALRLLLERERSTQEKPAPPLVKVAVITKLSTLEKPLRKLGVAGLSLFGSVAHDSANAGSDVDVLIQVAPKRPFSLVDLSAVRNYLQEQLGRPVDVVTREGLDSNIRDRVLREALQVF